MAWGLGLSVAMRWAGVLPYTGCAIGMYPVRALGETTTLREDGICLNLTVSKWAKTK